MRILLLCDRVPDAPSDGLLLRVLALARELASRHSIDVLCVGSSDAELPAGLFRHSWVAQPTPPRPRGGWLAALGGWSPDALYVPNPGLARLFEEIHPADYDVIWDAGAVLFAQLPAHWAQVPVLADLVDDMVLTYRRATASQKRLVDKLRYWKYTQVFARFERDTMQRVAHCVVVGEEDAASFATVSPKVPVSVVANGVDTQFFAADDTPELPNRLVFEGTMSFAPNEQAAVHLVTEVMPLVWGKRPDITVALVGRDPSAAVRALASERVIVTGSVPDVRRYVLEAAVFVCPLLAGAGIKNKLLQAWAMERAIVATTLSIGGLSATDGSDLLVRDGASAMAGAILELLADPARRRTLGATGRRIVEERFAWSTMGDRFESLLTQISTHRTG